MRDSIASLSSPVAGLRREGSTFSRASFDSDWQSIGSNSLVGAGRGRFLLAYKDMLLGMLYGEDQRRAMGAMVSAWRAIGCGRETVALVS